MSVGRRPDVNAFQLAARLGRRYHLVDVSAPGQSVTASSVQRNESSATALYDAADVVLSFGASMLRAGNTAIRTHEWMEVLTQKMGFETPSTCLSLDTLTIRLERNGVSVTAIRDVGPPGINAWRIGELEKLGRTAQAGASPGEIAARLAKVDSVAALYSDPQITGAIALASGALAFINGAPTLEIVAAGFGGGIGQWLRLLMARHRFNHYGAAALSAVAASGGYVLAATSIEYFGVGSANHPAGFLSSVLFLVPGFPLIAALFDLLQYQTFAAVGRFVYGVMILLAVAFGLSIVVAIAGVDLSPKALPDVGYPLKLALRAVASFVAGSAFAIMFNNSRPMVLVAGLLATGANVLRLTLRDFGMMPASAAFIGALFVGAVALWVARRYEVPRAAIVVPAIIIMVPGLAAFQTIVFFNRGEMLEALQAFATCGFGVGALAAGLATVRLLGAASKPGLGSVAKGS